MTWIKMSTDLHRRREVILVAEQEGISIHEVIGYLWALWSWFDLESSDGQVEGVDLEILSKATGIPSRVTSRLRHVGWLESSVTDGVTRVTIPNWKKYCWRSRKQRMNDAERARRYRDRKKLTSRVTSRARSCDVQSVTRHGRHGVREEKMMSSSSKDEDEDAASRVTQREPLSEEEAATKHFPYPPEPDWSEPEFCSLCGEPKGEAHACKQIGESPAETLQFYLGLGPAKAIGYVEVKGIDADCAEDWKHYAERKGRKLACHYLRAFRHPSEIPEEREQLEAKQKQSDAIKDVARRLKE